MTRPILSYSRIAFLYLGWWMVWMAAQAAVIVNQGFDWNTAILDAVITQLIFAVAGYTINTSMHAYQPGARNALYVLAWSVALAGLCVVAQRWILLQVLPENPVYLAFLEKTLIIRGAFGWLMVTLVAILTWFWVYAIELRENEKRKDDAERLAREAELSNLRQQLQPHFLFNSLNSISALAGTNPEEARKMIQQLSDFLRGTMRKDDKTLVSLEEEFRHLQLYLDIEKVRFGHRLITKIDKSEECLTMKLPSLLLQPVVENAIKFGLYDTVGEIVISVSAKNDNGLLLLQVTNPFDPATATRKQGTGFGLSSVRRRLNLLYFRNDLVTATSENTTFITTIRIPQTV